MAKLIALPIVEGQNKIISRLQAEREFFVGTKKKFADPKKLRPFIIKVEGGLSGISNDLASNNYCPTPLNGKFYHTNQGITYATWVHYMGKDRDLAFLKLDQRDWMYIFINGYWNVGQASKIYSQEVANMLVDWIWGSGKWGIVFTQRIVGVVDDGIVGKNTLKAINHTKKDELIQRMYNRRKKHFEDIANLPGQSIFLKGWLNRLNSLMDFNRSIFCTNFVRIKQKNPVNY